MKRWIIALCLMMLCLAGCAPAQVTPNENVPYPVVTIEMENDLVMQAELYPAVAPNTVANFVSLIESGFFNSGEMTFFRVVPGFVIQAGDPGNSGFGGPDYTIAGEFSKNGVENTLKHERGILSMARTSDPNSAGSQFFILHGNAAYLDGEYAAFGKLIGQDSYEVLDLIANTGTDASERPLIDYKIKRITVDTKGYQYSVVKYEED